MKKIIALILAAMMLLTFAACASKTTDTADSTADTTTSRFANLNLQFGRNYDPTHK